MSLSAPTAPKAFTHLTVIPDRQPRQKAHTSLGHAKAAVGLRINNPNMGTYYPIQVYELVDGTWSLLWDLPQGTKRPDLPWNN